MLASATDRGHRVRVVAYLLLVVAGVGLGISGVRLGIAPHWVWIALGSFLTVGGVVSAWGQTTRKWTGEFMGLPLIWSSLTAFSVIQALSLSIRDGVLLVLGIANLSLLLAFAAIAIARWVDVCAVYRAAKEHADAQR